MDNKTKAVRGTILGALLLFFQWGGPVVGWVSGILGIVVDAPQAMEGVSEWGALIPALKWIMFAALVVALWKLPPLAECDAWITAKIKSWLDAPHVYRWRYYLGAFVGGLVMAGSSVAVARNGEASILGLSIIAGIGAFFAVYLLSLAARSDTSALENSLAEVTATRDDYESQLRGQSNLVKLVQKKLYETFTGYIKEGEEKLRQRKEELITLEDAKDWFGNWKMKWYAVEQGCPFTSGLRIAAFRPRNDLPIYLEKGSPDAGFYLACKKELLFIEERILPQLKQ